MDNAAMIAGLAAKRWEQDDFDDLTLSAAARSAI
jgi:tRNA A37 threonylcarbamoyltransferase TsaD